VKRIEEKFTPLVKLCKETGPAPCGLARTTFAQRPIMNRFGRHADGMVESALELPHRTRQLSS